MTEQPSLIETGPEHTAEIVDIAKKYKTQVGIRTEALAKEKELKQKILSLVKEEHLTPLDDGRIEFTVDDIKIVVKPRDELVQIKEIEGE